MSEHLNSHSNNLDLLFKSSSSNWYVICTKPRNELKVNERLSLMGIKTYCPTIIKVSQWSDRKKKIKTPALPCMVLVNLKEIERNKVFDCPGVIRYMSYNKKIVIISQNEIDILRNTLKGKNCISSSISSLKIGQQIKVEHFQNRVGEIVQISSKTFWLRLHSLNIKVRLDII